MWHFNFPDPWDSTSNKPNPVFSYDSAGNYLLYLKVKDGYNCYDTAKKYIKVLQSPFSAFTFTDNFDGMTGKIQLHNKSLYATSLKWDLGNGRTSRDPDPIVSYASDGIYKINLITSNANNCFDTSYYDYEVHFRGLYIPNAFAPSSTNIAIRLFKPVGVNLKEYHIMVFDTWGHQLWESTKLDLQGKPLEGWDGTVNGQLMPQGVYVWKATAVFDDDSIWSGSDIGKGDYSDMGTVTLLR